LEQALERTRGAKQKAAELLGISFRSFRYRLAKYELGGDDDATEE
ncbi:MAG: helix-turn-helix domain-containing protein, partial [Desulfobacteria bacterium]